MKEGGSYHKTDLQKIKGLRKDTEETADKLEEIITYLEDFYMGRRKRSKELKEIEDYYTVITEKRDEVIKPADTVKVNRNTDKATKERERRENNTGKRDADGERGEKRRPGEVKQFKEPTGGSHKKTRKYLRGKIKHRGKNS